MYTSTLKRMTGKEIRLNLSAFDWDLFYILRMIGTWFIFWLKWIRQGMKMWLRSVALISDINGGYSPWNLTSLTQIAGRGGKRPTVIMLHLLSKFTQPCGLSWIS